MKSLEKKELALQNSSSQEERSSVLRRILASSAKYKAVASLSGIAYWLIYGYSTGMYFYYSFDATQYLKASGMTNPYFIPPSSFGDLTALYDSGVVWFPTSHLQFNFLFGQTFFSALLSILFSLSILLLLYSFRFKGLSKKGQGLAGIFGIVPALFSGGCCAVPVATLLLGSIVPSSVLFNFEFGDPLLMNLVIVILMLSSIMYTSKKIAKARDTCKTCNV